MTDPLEVVKWTCEYCTFDNWPASKKCSLCRAPKQSQLIHEHAPSREQDIYKMAPLVSDQSGGSTSETGHSSVSLSQNCDANNKWPCQTCTYLNWPKAVRCTQCLSTRAKAVPVITPSSSTKPLSINVNITQSSITSGSSSKSRRNSPRTSPKSAEATKSLNNDKNRTAGAASPSLCGSKWTCRACTYENWPKSQKCILCGQVRKSSPDISLSTSPAPSPGTGTPSESEASVSRPALVSPTGLSSAITSHSSRSSSSENIAGSHLVGATAALPQQQPDRHSHTDSRKLRLLQNRLRDMDWLWLSACQAVVDGDTQPIQAFLSGGGDPARQLTQDDCTILNRPSAFEVGYTLVHLAIRFQREDMLAILLTATDVVTKARKRVPSYVAPDIATDILRLLSTSLRQRKGDFPCYFLMEGSSSTFSLPAGNINCFKSN